MRRLSGALLTVFLVAGAPAALAQGTSSDDVTAQANVLTAVNVTAQQDLDFGNVIPGTNKAIGITSASAGRWLVTGSASAEVALSFPALPATLTDGGNNLAIVYSGTDAGFNTVNDPNTASTFDPSGGTTTNLGVSPAELFVWIGGQVVPGGSQPAGLYTGLITMQATYTGN